MKTLLGDEEEKNGDSIDKIKEEFLNNAKDLFVSIMHSIITKKVLS